MHTLPLLQHVWIFFSQGINAIYCKVGFFPHEINALIAFIAKCFFTLRNKCTYYLYCEEFFPQEINAHLAFIATYCLGFFPPGNKCTSCLYCKVWVFLPQEINAHIAFTAKRFFPKK